MTRRERLEAKAEKRREWAAGRTAKATALVERDAHYRGDYAFNTQPGHIPERARVIRRADQAIEHAQMAKHHIGHAVGIEQQLDRTVFSDDPDAVDQLEARIAENESKRAKMVAINTAWRRARKPAPNDPEGWERVVDHLIVSGGACPKWWATREEIVEALRKVRLGVAVRDSWRGYTPYEAYELSNLAGRIRADKERIKAVQAQQQRIAAAETNGGVTIEGDTWVRVTFAEKPEREILDALKTAGFRWSGGGWIGERTKLPEGIACRATT